MTPFQANTGACGVQAKHGEKWFDVNRIFPTQHVGTDQGWHFDYPVLEARFLF